MKTRCSGGLRTSRFPVVQVALFALAMALVGGCAPSPRGRDLRKVNAELIALKARLQRVEKSLARIRTSRAARLKLRRAPQPRPLLPIKKLGPWKYQITSMAKDDFLRSIMRRPGGGGFVAASNAQGVLIGFKLLRAKPRSIFTLLGFQDGDVFLSINGIRLTDISKVSTLGTKLANTRLVQIEIQRNMQTLTFTYIVKKFIW